MTWVTDGSELLLQVNRYSSQGRANRYICFARTQSRYVLGAQSRSFVSGFGKDAPERAADRGASCPLPPNTCDNLNGLLNPDPNPNVLPGALMWVSYPMSCLTLRWRSLGSGDCTGHHV